MFNIINIQIYYLYLHIIQPFFLQSSADEHYTEIFRFCILYSKAETPHNSET